MSLAEAWETRRRVANPCRHIERFFEEARKRYLSVAHLSRTERVLGELVAEEIILPMAALTIELLLLTGARLNGILSVGWKWVEETQCVC